jgi:hypothetical protein
MKGRRILAEHTSPDSTEPRKSEEYQRFENLAKGLFAVPKAELNAPIKKTVEAKNKPDADLK